MLSSILVEYRLYSEKVKNFRIIEKFYDYQISIKLLIKLIGIWWMEEVSQDEENFQNG